MGEKFTYYYARVVVNNWECGFVLTCFLLKNHIKKLYEISLDLRQTLTSHRTTRDATRSSYSIIRQRGKCSLKYENSSADAPAQFVSSSSCKCLNCMILERPLDVNSGQPASDKTCRLRIEQRCCNPKSRIWEHQRRNNAWSEIIVEMYPTPISLMWMHLFGARRSDEEKECEIFFEPLNYMAI